MQEQLVLWRNHFPDICAENTEDFLVIELRKFRKRCSNALVFWKRPQTIIL